MKFLLAFLLMASIAWADDTEVVFGSLTYHLIGTHTDISQHFHNRVADEGMLISNPLVGVRYNSNLETDDYTEYPGYNSVTYFGGQNSMGSPMFGRTSAYGFKYKSWDSAILGGLYIQDASRFHRYGSFGGGFPIGNLSINPVIGWEINYKTGWHGLKVCNVISPALTVTYLSLPF